MSDHGAEFGAELTVDLDAIADNWRLLSRRVPTAECGAVVKADAYGCGIEQVVPALTWAGCHTFFVAHLSEARRVRKVAADATIYVLNGLLPGSASAFHAVAARPVLSTVEEIAEWIAHGRNGPAALHVDTGMNRLGLSVDDAISLQESRKLDEVSIGLLMTHFSSAEVQDDPANLRQVTRFAELAESFPDTSKSLLNSSGHFLGVAPPYQLTRPGYALYGGNPVPGDPNPMKAVVKLTARILQTRVVGDGEAVGYNGRWHAKGRRKLATICLGYADGFPRNASYTDVLPGGYAMVGGVKCPFAGTVSMDLIIIDVSEAPAGSAERGSEVTLIGDGLDLDSVAVSGKTVGYELLTSLGRRYTRTHVGG
ncbi:MAG: alanine racemase [Bosea sp. (in: a-proteobacteria)]